MFASAYIISRAAVILVILGLWLSARPVIAAKNIILMIGDGMGFKHVEAARNYLGTALAMQSLPVHFAVSTYEYGGSYSSVQAWSDFNYVKSGATDSASAATAMATGMKTDNGRISVSHNALERLTNMTEYARMQGWSSGVVSSVPFSHATPAAFAAHNNSRNNYSAIAREMITSFGDGTGARGNTPTVEVIIGGGSPVYASGYIGSNEYTALKNGTTGQGWTFVERKSGVDGSAALAAAAGSSSKLFGLYGGSGGNIPYRLANGSGRNVENPTLADMSLAALSVLEDDPDGMFLMIEGGAIDWASHANNIDQMIGEVIDFDMAVAAVMGWVSQKDPDWNDTLLIVTADHETGYLTRGAGQFPNIPLGNPGPGVLPQAGTHFAWNSTGHTNSLVPLYAKGAGSQLFSAYASNYDAGWNLNYLDNTDIFSLMRAAMVPEPSTIIILAPGFGGILLYRKRGAARRLTDTAD